MENQIAIHSVLTGRVGGCFSELAKTGMFYNISITRCIEYILLKQMSLRGAGGDAAIWFGDCRGRLGSLAMTVFTRAF